MKLVLTVDMAALRAAARAEIDAVFAARLTRVMGPASPVHALKAIEADRLLASVVALPSSPLLAPEAKKRGVTEAKLARMIRDKAAEKNAAVGAVEAERQAIQAQIDAASSPAALQTILQPYR